MSCSVFVYFTLYVRRAENVHSSKFTFYLDMSDVFYCIASINKLNNATPKTVPSNFIQTTKQRIFAALDRHLLWGL